MEPLAAKLRPKKLSDFIGQSALVGKGKSLTVAVEEKHLFSFILWGPPGVGKTTFARIYAHALNADYHELSAVSAGKDDIRKIVESGALFGPKMLFLDEIHRFNKAQQDFLLPFVESGVLTLIGATTENPSFEVIPALLSRCRIFVLNALSHDELITILARSGYDIPADAAEWVVQIANGDARQALTIIENTMRLYKRITLDLVTETAQQQFLRYDKDGEEHYNTISAFIKSMRASQPNAALYYMNRMLVGGEDPKFIARRMVIFASEDIGMLDSQALTIALSVFRAVEIIGMPECGINMAHACIYLSLAPKEKKVYEAYMSSLKDAKEYGNIAIPLLLRNAPTTLMKDLGYGEKYERYTTKELLPEKLKGKKYWHTD